MYKPEWLSEGAERLIAKWSRGKWSRGKQQPYDVLIVGSGYGGAVAAERLALTQQTDEHGNKRNLRVCVLERGMEHLPGTFPNSFSQLPGHVRFSRFDDPIVKGVAKGLFDIRVGKDVSVLLASGLGGGSLINAGVAATPHPEVFKKGWPKQITDEFSTPQAIDAAYGAAARALGAEIAQIEKTAEFPRIAKHDEFVDLTRRLGGKAFITVDHGECKRCGDCATGCNFGAKKTLSTSFLAEARRHGVEIYTGATVSHIEKRHDGWSVFLALTAQPRPLVENPLHEVRARTVILAAGAFGSPEILMRSKERCRDLGLSQQLGERFSINGDMISALYNQPRRVNAAPAEDADLERRFVGPTITGIARKGTSAKDRVVIEELAIPGALRRVFEEVVTTSAMLDNFGRNDFSDHEPITPRDPQAEGQPIREPKADTFAVDGDAIERTQVFACMGDDGAGGRLELVPGWNTDENVRRVQGGAIRVHWPKAGEHDIYRVQDDALVELAKDRGTFLRNPLWQPIPKGISGSLSGKKPSGLLFSVHPLCG